MGLGYESGRRVPSANSVDSVAERDLLVDGSGDRLGRWTEDKNLPRQGAECQALALSGGCGRRADIPPELTAVSPRHNK